MRRVKPDGSKSRAMPDCVYSHVFCAWRTVPVRVRPPEHQEATLHADDGAMMSGG